MLSLARRISRSKLSVVSGAILGLSTGYYLVQDEPQRRKIRVTVQGIARFVRYAIVSYIQEFRGGLKGLEHSNVPGSKL